MINEKLNKDILDLINENKTAIENINGEIIYENNQGDDIDIICSKNINNFDSLRFDFMHQKYYSSIVVPIIDNKVQIFSVGVPDGNTTVQLMVQRYTINDNELHYDGEGMVNFNNRTINWQSYDTNMTTMKIHKIVGIKRNQL